MSKMLLILFLVFGLSIMSGSSYGQGLYKWVDEKGTVHYSDNPTSGVGVDLEPSPPPDETDKWERKIRNWEQGEAEVTKARKRDEAEVWKRKARDAEWDADIAKRNSKW